jgi:hypothetical protein
MDARGADIQVDVDPTKTEGFPAPASGDRDEAPQCAELVLARRGEERSHLIATPDARLGALRGR